MIQVARPLEGHARESAARQGYPNHLQCLRDVRLQHRVVDVADDAERCRCARNQDLGGSARGHETPHLGSNHFDLSAHPTQAVSQIGGGDRQREVAFVVRDSASCAPTEPSTKSSIRELAGKEAPKHAADAPESRVRWQRPLEHRSLEHPTAQYDARRGTETTVGHDLYRAEATKAAPPPPNYTVGTEFDAGKRANDPRTKALPSAGGSRGIRLLERF